ncbi:squalene--hopene cyclase [Candidatus Uabimicrobium sp. HlEnr_7]|uniref:squalene--hopene cyclase n=1 Tax=Candidatus Uabimicrobium helgolandensis TaxID=3095367 RepID=UPI00355797A6
MNVNVLEAQRNQTDITDINSLVSSAVNWLKKNQNEEGYWVGMLESNSCMEAEWILMQHFLGIDGDHKYNKVVQCILNEQRADGSWEVFYDAPSGDINTTVESYAALRVAGVDLNSEPMVKARTWILQRDLKSLRVFTKYWLALIGEWPWEYTPQLPPELIFLPSWSPLNIYKFSSWARGTLVPMAILSANRPVRPLPPEKRLDELFPQGRENLDYSLPRDKSVASWESLFLVIDRALNIYTKLPWKPMRKLAKKLCVEWVIERQEADGAWSGIQPPWVYSLMALNTENYSIDHPVLDKGLSAFDKHWSYEKGGGIYLQASESPVWDTVLSCLAMLDCDVKVTENEQLQKAMKWILNKQIKEKGDWQVYSPKAPCGGWSFERANNYYPDTDDTAVALIVLSKMCHQLQDSEQTQKMKEAINTAKEWLLELQSSNGGWGAFDKNNNSKIVTKIPFCDFGEALDPPSVDVTAHVVEAFGEMGYDKHYPPVARAIRYMKNEQEEDGSWFGRWGVNYIYGTAAVLPALKVVGEDMNSEYIHRAAEWIMLHQNSDGGWGETCQSYIDESLKGKGESTPSQTGWALMALLAVDSNSYDNSILKGIEWLKNNHEEGSWDENQYTGTGFPGYGVGERVFLKKVKGSLQQGSELSRAFMINYNYYRHYFPLMALGRAQKHFSKQNVY